MYGGGCQQPIIIKQTAPSRKRKSGPSYKAVRKYKRAYYAARRFRRAVGTAHPRGSDGSKAFWGVDYANANADQKALRSAVGFRGKGDYLTDIGKWGSRAVGMGIGGLIGGIPGSAVGHRYGAKFSKWMGWGDYGGDAGGNQIMAGSVTTPMTVNAADDLSGDIYLSHREFLGNVTALGTGTTTPSAFNLVSYPINSGLQATFPWLSQIAQNFTLYELIGCVFEYKPTSGELGSASNALGKIVMATQYDPDAADFSSTVEMENYDYNDSCKPSEHMIHGIETKRSQAATNMLYVRSGPSSKDKIFTDYGNFQIATEGLPVNAASGTIINVGELWVTYRVKLSRAKLFGSLLGANVGFDTLYGVSTAGNLGGGTNAGMVTNGWSQYPTNNAVNTLAPRVSNNIGCSAVGTDAKTIVLTFPKNIVTGSYRIQWQVTNSAAYTMVFNAPVVNAYATLPLANGIDYNPFTATFSTAQVFTAIGYSQQSFIVQVNAPGTTQATVTLSVANNLTTGSVSSVNIMEIPRSLITA